jgi:hypothetical protein
MAIFAYTRQSLGDDWYDGEHDKADAKIFFRTGFQFQRF